MTARRPRRKRRVPWVFRYVLALALASTAFGVWAFVKGLRVEIPADTERLDGVIRDARVTHSYRGWPSSVTFSLMTAPDDMTYGRVDPSFDAVSGCLVPGARVTRSSTGSIEESTRTAHAIATPAGRPTTSAEC